MKDVEENASLKESASLKENIPPKSDTPVNGSRKNMRISPPVEFLIRLGATVLAVWLVLTFVAGVCVCHTDSCSPMIKDGDLCVMWKPGALSAGDVTVARGSDASRRLPAIGWTSGTALYG